MAVIHNSDRVALRLVPCDVLARVAPSGDLTGSAFEVEVARRLAGVGAPVAGLEPRGALSTLTAAATATERLRLGTLVTSVKPR